MVRSDMDMHHYLPPQYLEGIWSYIAQRTEHPDLAKFRGMFFVLNAKNIKLQARTPTFQACRRSVMDHLTQLLDWPKADLSNAWIDVSL